MRTLDGPEINALISNVQTLKAKANVIGAPIGGNANCLPAAF
jgi:hypothetical protein